MLTLETLHEFKLFLVHFLLTIYNC